MVFLKFLKTNFSSPPLVSDLISCLMASNWWCMLIPTGHTSVQLPHREEANGNSGAFSGPKNSGVTSEPIGPG